MFQELLHREVPSMLLSIRDRKYGRLARSGQVQVRFVAALLAPRSSPNNALLLSVMEHSLHHPVATLTIARNCTEVVHVATITVAQ